MKRITEDLSPHLTDLMAAIARYHDARKEGAATAEAADHELEPALRQLLPSRGEPTQPICALCDDTGFRVMICDHAMRCGRKRCSMAEESYEHTYAEDCLCEPGQARRAGRDAAAARERLRREARAATGEEAPRGRRRR